MPKLLGLSIAAIYLTITITDFLRTFPLPARPPVSLPQPYLLPEPVWTWQATTPLPFEIPHD